MRAFLISLLVFGLSLMAPPSVAAQTADTPSISAEEMERRSKDIGRQLRCVACQNQSIEESPSMAAQDMRLFIQERLEAGLWDEAIIEELHKSYGDYILLKPPLKPSTYLLWGLPFILLLSAGLWFWRAVRKYSGEQA